MQKIDIIAMFAEEGYQVSPDVVEVISTHGSPVELVKHILATIDESVFVVKIEHIDLDGFRFSPEDQQTDIHSSNMLTNTDPISSSIPSSPPFSSFPSSSSSSSASQSLGGCNCKPECESKYAENPVDIISDITDQSTCVGEYMEFIQYFRNRYRKLSGKN